MKSLLMVVGVVMTIGCTKANPKSCIDNHCSDPDLPFCDVDGAIGGEPNTCIAVSCTPGAFETCRGDRALTCNSAGDNYDLVECEFGCGADDGGCKVCDSPECEKRIIPRYVPTVCDQLSNGGALNVLTADATLDTTSELNCTQIIPQTSAPEICVVRHSAINIGPNRTYRATGSRVLALVSDRDVTISGTLDVSATGPTSGPGGGFTKSGSCMMTGGGGAGARTAGAPGGTTTAGGAANGGSAQPHPSSITDLRAGTQPSAEDCVPGGAGGAVTVISCRGTLRVTGIIDANGGGGLGSNRTGLNDYRNAGGGGSGGTVVLQAVMLDIDGQLFANGGAGGGGCSGYCDDGNGTLLSSAQPGDDGRSSTEAARGGMGDIGGGGGGNGGTAAAPISGAGHTGGFGGGGGGSAGFLLTYTPADVTPSIAPTTVSPPLSTHGTIPTN